MGLGGNLVSTEKLAVCFLRHFGGLMEKMPTATPLPPSESPQEGCDGHLRTRALLSADAQGPAERARMMATSSRQFWAVLGSSRQFQTSLHRL